METTERFWDCFCKKNYIRTDYEEECIKCHAVREDAPDSRISEVEAAGLAEFGRMCGETVSKEDSDDCPNMKWHDLIELIVYKARVTHAN